MVQLKVQQKELKVQQKMQQKELKVQQKMQQKELKVQQQILRIWRIQKVQQKMQERGMLKIQLQQLAAPARIYSDGEGCSSCCCRALA